MQVQLPSDDRIFMHFVHPDPPNPKYATETTERDAELLVVGREVEKRDKPTINAKIPLLRWPLDHVFHSDHFKLVHMETGPAWGSDHFPIFIELSLDSGAEAEQEGSDTDQTEDQQVDEKIEEGKQKPDE